MDLPPPPMPAPPEFHPDLPPRPAPRPGDPPAVAIGNASLLGVGYFVLGRRKLGIAAAFVTVVLLTVLASAVRTVWMEVAVLGWWAAVVAHGWFLARRSPREGVRRQRLVALAITVPVLLVVGFFRFDAARIEGDVTEARGEGDCGRAVTALDELGAVHHVVDAPLTVRGEVTAEACARLRVAEADLDAALTGDVTALEAGFGRLADVLTEVPGHERMVERALDGFLAGLPLDDPCRTVAVTDWLGEREPTGHVLDRAADVVPRTAPAALVACGANRAAAEDWQPAREVYQQLLDQYPGHELAGKATEGVQQATRALELANVRSLLAPTYGDAQPAYCSRPAPYSGAPAYRAQNPNRALIYGNTTYAQKLPREWIAGDAADAVLIICAGETELGAAVQTCPYESKSPLGGVRYVTFHKIAIPVRVYELRTGQVVHDTRLEIGGTSCPPILSYTSFTGVDLGPPSQVHVTPSDADVHAPFHPLINP
ncbi:hypothetical protein LZG04_14390 [Saccharothrix sp. S26]|uniref:hypothetical protein n=1 Tax=Saccharothrix sp. S26 TaxID=2907215 RepID=UPI001F2B5146|nr:hypothetical protein [Saccharothrix sp. S26]MCE6995983.1 hypothetical protein [Saccharothrix sp. S26]